MSSRKSYIRKVPGRRREKTGRILIMWRSRRDHERGLRKVTRLRRRR